MSYGPAGLREVMAMLLRYRASGALKVVAGEDRGLVAVLDGQIQSAFFNHLCGPQALSRLLLSGPGTAWVDPVAAVMEPNVVGDTQDILTRVDKVLAETHFDRLFGAETAATTIAPTPTADPLTTALNAADLDQALGAEPFPSDDPMMTMRTALLPPQIGSMVGRCVLKKELGQGASSVVYLAHHTALHIDVVVKVLIPGQGGPDAAGLTTNEARTLAKLNHPSILRVYDYDESDRFPFLIIEHIAGGSLQDRIDQDQALPENLVIDALRQCAKALAYAQARVGLVHGDIKPANILLRDDGRAALIDFGLAMITDKAGKVAPTIGTTMFRRQVRGTPSYLAPELVSGGTASWASDAYALGCTAYHALTGRTPYSDNDPIKLMMQHTTGGYMPVDLLRKDADPRLVAVVHRLLSLRPQDRHPSPGALVADLENLGDPGDPNTASDPRRTTFWQHLGRAVRRA